MKQFVYLDTDSVNSIIAQSNSGLIGQKTTETSDLSSETTHKELGGSGTGSVEGGLMRLAKFKGALSLEGKMGTGNESQSVLKEIETKTLHDAAFDIAHEYISTTYSVEGTNTDIGSYVELDRTFDFVDFNYIDSLFSEDGFLSYIKKTEKEKIEIQAQSVTESLPREQRRKSGTALKQELKKIIDTNNKQYDDIMDIVKIIKSLIPYSKMLVSSDGYLIPLEDKHFRDNPKTIGFKHGGSMTCFGYITNVIGQEAEPDSGNIFGTLQHMVNEIIRSLIPTQKDNLFILHPIALYYDQRGSGN